MSVFQRITKFVQDNVVLITGGAIIISTHWGWSRLQQTRLVPEDKRTELPIIIGARYLEKKIVGEFEHLSNSAASTPEVEKEAR